MEEKEEKEEKRKGKNKKKKGGRRRRGGGRERRGRKEEGKKRKKSAKKIFGHKREKVTGDWRNCMKGSFVICTRHRTLLDDTIIEEETGGACSMNARHEKHV